MVITILVEDITITMVMIMVMVTRMIMTMDMITSMIFFKKFVFQNDPEHRPRILRTDMHEYVTHAVANFKR